MGNQQIQIPNSNQQDLGSNSEYLKNLQQLFQENNDTSTCIVDGFGRCVGAYKNDDEQGPTRLLFDKPEPIPEILTSLLDIVAADFDLSDIEYQKAKCKTTIPCPLAFNTIGHEGHEGRKATATATFGGHGKRLLWANETPMNAEQVNDVFFKYNTLEDGSKEALKIGRQKKYINYQLKNDNTGKIEALVVRHFNPNASTIAKRSIQYILPIRPSDALSDYVTIVPTQNVWDSLYRIKDRLS